jgi:esterase/lipase superfamily enzyme
MNIFSLRRILPALAFALLTACTPRGTITVVPPDAVPGPIVPLYVGTTRQLDDGGLYGPGRSETLGLARYDIAIPPARQVGKVVFPKRPTRPDPQTDFLTTAQVFYPTETRFRAELSRALDANHHDAVIFVHGFNNTFAEGLYRFAQLDHDLQLPGVAVQYSWPSAAQPLGYVEDRESVLFARDGLEQLIREVSAAGAQRIILVAHSMGAHLTMEALRQIALRGDRGLMNRIDGVVLISPDIDVDVFRMTAKTIGQLPEPFIIFGSPRDGVLRLSGFITGQQGRLGALEDVNRLADLDVTYIDVAAFRDGTGHFTAATSPALISLIGGINDVNAAFSGDAAARTGLLPGAVITFRSATRIILSPLSQITGTNLTP